VGLQANQQAPYTPSMVTYVPSESLQATGLLGKNTFSLNFGRLTPHTLRQSQTISKDFAGF